MTALRDGPRERVLQASRVRAIATSPAGNGQLRDAVCESREDLPKEMADAPHAKL